MTIFTAQASQNKNPFEIPLAKSVTMHLVYFNEHTSKCDKKFVKVHCQIKYSAEKLISFDTVITV